MSRCAATDFLFDAVIVLVAQIRAGLWVRNGFGMRAQQLHYKEYSLRENTYDQDIFFLQTAFVILDPSVVLIAILDRFQVQDWLGGADEHPTYEPSQAFAMVEEMLYLLIVLLSDPTYAAGLAPETCLRRELVHNLCLGPSAYSDLMRRVSEKFTDDPALDRILADVAIFKLPVGISDQGTYTLRTECFAEVDPYFPRYSRNQREEADKLVREQLKKDAPDSDPIIVPSPLSISSGPFVTLHQAFISDVLHQIIFFAMQHGRARGALFSEVLVDEALHLTMLSLVEEPESFAAFAAERVLSNTPGESTLVHLLVTIEEDERMKAVRHKARWCLDRLAERVGASVNALRKVEDTASPAKALDAKRLAAKARQAAILKQFAAAQKSFLESSENVDDEEDDEMYGGEKVSSLGSCIVCQDELDASRPFGSLGLIQTSNILRLTPEGDADFDFQGEVLATPSSLDRDASSIRPFGLAAKKIAADLDDETGDGISKGFPQHHVSGLHASACGHLMHQSCFDTYYRSLEQRHHLQPTRCHPENTERREFICPLCKSLGNVLLPASVEGDVYAKLVVEGERYELDQWARAAMHPDGRATLLQLSQDDAPRSYSYETNSVQLAFNLRYKLRNGLTPWEIATTLPESKPEEFEEGERLMIAGMLEVANSLMQEIGSDVVAFLPKWLIGYTISAIEVASRGQSEAPISQATERMLRSLLLSLRELAFVATRSEASARIAAFAILPHLGGMFDQDHRRVDFFQLDPLTTLVEIAAVYPVDFYHVAAFAFYTELVQVYFGVANLFDASSDPLAFEADAADEATPDYLALAHLHLRFVAPSDSHTPAFLLTLGKRLYSYVLPFLRRAAILHGVLFGPSPSAVVAGSELSRLLTLLRIPHPSDALRHRDILPPGVDAIQAHIEACQNSIPGWKQGLASPPPGSVDGSTALPSALPEASVSCAGDLQHPAIYELVGLPVQLDTLAAESLQRKCERCHHVPSEPALCLLCGQMVCHQSFCCMDGEDEAQHGECNMHMWT